MTHKFNLALMALLLAVIIAIGCLTAVTSARELGYATLVSYTQYLSGDGVFAQAKARIKSLNGAIDINLFSKSFFQSFNVKFQLLIGKEMLSYGSRTMVKLNGGQLYDIQPDADVTDDLNKMEALNKALSERGIPMLYVYMHSELYEDDMLPTGIQDYNNKVAGDIVNGLRERGITVIDSRDVMNDYGLSLDQVVYRTDQHCAIPLNFSVHSEIVKYLNGELNWDLDEAAINPDNYEIETLTERHMGDVGARVGDKYVTADDYVLMTPKFETNIKKSLSSSKGFIESEGTFSEAVLNLDVLDKLEDELSANIYDVYGYHTEIVKYINENVSAKKLMLVKDSFGTPVTSFMSLSVGEVVGVDVRKTQRSIESYVDEYEPEAVLIVHCQEMMRGRNYAFVDGNGEE